MQCIMKNTIIFLFTKIMQVSPNVNIYLLNLNTLEPMKNLRFISYEKIYTLKLVFHFLKKLYHFAL